MGKKVKKKARSGQKDKRVISASPKAVSKPSSTSIVEATDDKVVVVKDRKICPHLDKGVSMDKLSAKIGSSEPVKCEDCREGADDRRASKGKGKRGKKKGGVESKSESKAIWVCLECGHFSCGGVGLPTRPQTHAIRHARQNHHPLAVQFENPQLRWCFQCSTLIPAEKSEDGAEQNDVLHDIAKMIKRRPSGTPALDVEEVWFGSGCVLSGIKAENDAVVGSDGRGGYSVRGLVNLGNTCFFNSVMQNLLALDQLRDFFFKLDESAGPLTAALNKLVGEISLESGSKNVVNPNPFFGCVCAKAPQFRGYQQQDSHELLRCLLDGLFTEESSARKKNRSSHEDGNSDPTFVEALFGGQLSSTVTCLECGHTSIVCEPFLDLSLPVPIKKPPSRKAQAGPRAKNPKPPPRRSGRIHPKLKRDTNDKAGESSSRVRSSIPAPEHVVSSGESTDASVMANYKSVTSDNISTAQNAETNHAIENVIEKPTLPGDFTWLDYLEEDTVSSTNTLACQVNDGLVNQEFSNKNPVQKDDPFQDNLEWSETNVSSCTDAASYSDNVTWMDSQRQERLSDTQDTALQINEKSVVQDCVAMDTIQNDVDLKNSSKDLNLGANFLGNFSEEATPLLIQDSAVLLLPYKEDVSATGTSFKTEGEASSSAVAYEQDSMDFDGFGDIFNEPEAAGPSSINISETNDVVKAGFVGHSSESEQDEVDNTDAPVSVESCLAYFTKLELLSKDEHAWQCENCSKVLQDERMRLRKKLQNTRSKNRINEVEDKDTSSNGRIKIETSNTPDGSCMLESAEQTALNPVDSQRKDKQGELEVSPVDLPESSSGEKTFCQLNNNCKSRHEVNVDEPGVAGLSDGNIQEDESPTARGDSEASEDEKTDSEKVKVERDATKKILINKAPPILTIHLKRFSQDARGRLSKLNGHVQFNHTIDLKPFLDPSCTGRDNYKYQLVGVVEHSGTMRGGHYVAYVRGGSKTKGKAEMQNNEQHLWYYASDAYVRESSLEEVLGSEAYILFYERV